MIGIGLGGFVDGLEAGSKFRERRENRARDKVIQEREDIEYNRAVKDRDEISAINTQAQTDFKAKVDAGEYKPEEFDRFYRNDVVPRQKKTLLLQGKQAEADAWEKWALDGKNYEATQLAGRAIWNLQHGNPEAALDAALQASRIQGYNTTGYQIGGYDSLVDQSGKKLGYRFTLKGPDGKDVVQDVPMDKLNTMVAGIINPISVWEQQQAAAADQSKRQADMGDYRTKKEIDAQYSTSGKPTREDAIDALRKRFNGETKVTQDGAVDVPNFDDLSRDEKEKLIAEEIELQSGQPGLGAAPSAPASGGSSGRKVLMDTATGQPVAPERFQAPPQQQISGQARDERPPESRQDRVQFLLSSVEPALKEGVPAERVADELRQNGVPEQAWPEPLRRALAQRQRSAIGIGPQ